MAVAVANAKDSNGIPYFNVIGIDLPNDLGKVQSTRLLESTAGLKHQANYVWFSRSVLVFEISAKG